jgi:hypothetical protein
VNVDLVKSYVWFAVAAAAEALDERRWVEHRKKWNEKNPSFAHPMKIEKGEGQAERDKIAERLTKSQLIEAQSLIDRCLANNCEDFD